MRHFIHVKIYKSDIANIIFDSSCEFPGHHEHEQTKAILFSHVWIQMSFIIAYL